MGDETVSLDAIDRAIEQFNAGVDAAQEAAKRRAAERFAIETQLGEQDAYDLLAACQWSVTRARGMLARAVRG